MSDPNKEYAAKSIAAAQRSLADPNVTSVDAAKEANISRSGVTLARVILRFGTAADLADALNGVMGLRSIHDRVKAKLSPEQLEELKERNNSWTTKRRAIEASDAQVWTELSEVIKKLNGLPQPKDVVRIVMRNSVRKQFVNQQMFSAGTWMEEFLSEWTKPDHDK